jgi:hypothetical protein
MLTKLPWRPRIEGAAQCSSRVGSRPIGCSFSNRLCSRWDWRRLPRWRSGTRARTTKAASPGATRSGDEAWLLQAGDFVRRLPWWRGASAPCVRQATASVSTITGFQPEKRPFARRAGDLWSAAVWHVPRTVACNAGMRRAYLAARGRRGREAEGGGLLNRYRVVKLYRGFESLRLRHKDAG